MSTTSLREMVLRRADASYEFLAKDRTPTDDLDRAAAFKSRLGLMTFMKPMFGEEEGRWGWTAVFKDEILREHVKFEAPFDLLVKDPFEAVRRVYELHYSYCSRVEAWLKVAGVALDASWKPPQPKVTITGPTWAGLYTTGGKDHHVCHYPIVYAMMHLGDTGGPDDPNADFRYVVAHEVTHAYQSVFTGRKGKVGHGGDFYALMKHAAREEVGKHTHAHDAAEAARLADSLAKYWKLASVTGALASLPCEVETKGRKRKGAIR